LNESRSRIRRCRREGRDVSWRGTRRARGRPELEALSTEALTRDGFRAATRWQLPIARSSLPAQIVPSATRLRDRSCRARVAAASIRTVAHAFDLLGTAACVVARQRTVVRLLRRGDAGEIILPVLVELVPVDGVPITILMDSLTDPLLLSAERIERTSWFDQFARPRAHSTVYNDRLPDALTAQPGFSALVRVAKACCERTILVDAGVTPAGAVENRLELSHKDIETIVLSHGHWYHVAGMEGIAKTGRPSRPARAHASRVLAPTPHRAAGHRSGRAAVDQSYSTRGGRLHKRGGHQPSFLVDGSVLVTGEIDRTTGFEAGFSGHEAHLHRAWEPDALILDDQALVLSLAGRGLVVLTGCGHAGIINVLTQVRRLTRETRLAAVIGGFHLSGPMFAPIIEPTLPAFEGLRPGLRMPAHCIDGKAVHRLAVRFADALCRAPSERPSHSEGRMDRARPQGGSIARRARRRAGRMTQTVCPREAITA